MSDQIPLSDEASALEPELDAARRDKTNEAQPLTTEEALHEITRMADRLEFVDAPEHL